MQIKRWLQLDELLKKKSFFLFGPRSTGKSTLIRQQLSGKCIIIDLLDSEYFLRLSQNPNQLEKIVDAEKRIIVIDEIQKIPLLLDEVHRLIERNGTRFLLTGSSARKLKKEGVNLLAGRAWTANLFPLTFFELGKKFNLEKYLLNGGLPQVYLSESPREELKAYFQNYLQLEIQMEAVVRNLPQFTRFLAAASLCNGQLVNFSNIANDTGISASTIREYYHILEDTLIGFLLEPWTKSKKRKAISTAKFYFFDCGVSNFISATKALERNSNLYGNSFEHFIAMELKAYLSYERKEENLNFWRSINHQEVDFVIGDSIAIEVKSKTKTSLRDAKGLMALSEEKVFKSYYVISQDKIERKEGKVWFLHWEKFLQLLWKGEIYELRGK